MKQFYWPMYSVSQEEANRRLKARYERLAALGTIKEIRIEHQQEHPEFTRITRVRLVDEHGQSDTIRAEDLRLCLDPSGRRIRSTAFVLKEGGGQWEFRQGRGWGHAVGLCQCGAQGLAREGRQVDEILSFYYPEAEIVCLDSL